MNYKKLTREQIFSGEIDYTLEKFAKDFRKEAVEVWGKKRLDKKHKNSNTLYQALLLITAFTSQGRKPRAINKILLGKSSKELEENLTSIIDMYKQEIRVIEGLQMKMFLENIKKYRVPDSLNLIILNANFRDWLVAEIEKSY